MISFRTHVVTLVAVFLALAIGVVLGGGPLSEIGRGAENTEALQADVEKAQAEAAFGERFATDASAVLYTQKLEGREITVVTMPGADPSLVETLTDEIDGAGGEVVVTQELGSSFVNPTEKSLVDTLGSQLMTQLPNGTVSADASTYERAGELLGFTVATRGEQTVERSAESEAVADGLTGANLLPEVASGSGRAPLVLVVLGDEVTGDGADAILGGIVRGLAAKSRGVVLAGRTTSDDSQLARLREADELGAASSVDGVETAAGRVATVLALARAYDTQGGAFGATGSDGSLPLG
ncbi:copper transporter [Nocardioides gilvus]|uniref:copper transporter n=1 Tax=Nocardioides gilvus TaxID=1735589 RepID=UPI0013A55701|nr:copper transporter [Nocardioides gilvus]